MQSKNYGDSAKEVPDKRNVVSLKKTWKLKRVCCFDERLSSTNEYCEHTLMIKKSAH